MRSRPELSSRHGTGSVHSARSTRRDKEASTTWRTLIVASFAVAAAAQNHPTRLQPAETVTRQIAGNEVHDYTVALKPNQALNIVVKQLGANVVVIVSGPDGRVIAEVNETGARGSESVWIVSAAAGDHGIKVRSLSQERAGSYELHVAALREATDDDRKRLEMQKAFPTTLRLLNEGPASRADAREALEKAFMAARALKDTAMAARASTLLVQLDPKAVLDASGLNSGARGLGADHCSSTVRRAMDGAVSPRPGDFLSVGRRGVHVRDEGGNPPGYVRR